MVDSLNGEVLGQSTAPLDNGSDRIFQTSGTPNGINIVEDFVVITKNAHIHTNEKLSQVLTELKNVSWDVILFSETRAASGTVALDGGHVLYSHIDGNAFAGVGILLHAKHIRKNIQIHAISGRVLALEIMVQKIKMTAVAVYMPHCGYDFNVFEETYNQLRCVLGQANRTKTSSYFGRRL